MAFCIHTEGGTDDEEAQKQLIGWLITADPSSPSRFGCAVKQQTLTATTYPAAWCKTHTHTHACAHTHTQARKVQQPVSEDCVCVCVHTSVHVRMCVFIFIYVYINIYASDEELDPFADGLPADGAGFESGTAVDAGGVAALEHQLDLVVDADGAGDALLHLPVA